jgi:hypothetical protein
MSAYNDSSKCNSLSSNLSYFKSDKRDAVDPEDSCDVIILGSGRGGAQKRHSHGYYNTLPTIMSSESMLSMFANSASTIAASVTTPGSKEKPSEWSSLLAHSKLPYKSDSSQQEISASTSAPPLASSSSLLASAHSYVNSYIDSFAIDLNDQQRERVFFLPDEPVYIQIVDHEEEPSLVLLHTNVYIIRVQHANFCWTIKRKYKNFLKLYETYALFKTKLNIRQAAHLTDAVLTQQTVQPSLSNNCGESGGSKFKPSDHFKLIFQSIASDFEQVKSILEKFLQDVVDHKSFRNHNETVSKSIMATTKIFFLILVHFLKNHTIVF